MLSLEENQNISIRTAPYITHHNMNHINSIKLINILGKTVFQQTGFSESGENKLLLNLANFAKGIYMLEVLNGEQKNLRKIILQ